MDPADYPFCHLLERSYPAIRAELEPLLHMPVWAAMREGESAPIVPQPVTIDEGGPWWRLFGLYLKGRPVARGCQLCPHTAAVLSHLPAINKAGFACLDKGYVMAPHIGHDPHNYRIHLALRIPAGDCGMEVGGETRLWQEGQVSMFDDNQTHHAWNRTQENRFVLIVDVDNRRLT
jgi:beta-hydroxylase